MNVETTHASPELGNQTSVSDRPLLSRLWSNWENALLITTYATFALGYGFLYTFAFTGSVELSSHAFGASLTVGGVYALSRIAREVSAKFSFKL